MLSESEKKLREALEKINGLENTLKITEAKAEAE